mgnify:FL=1
MNQDKLRASLIRHEGVRTKPYIDTVGAISVGCGHNLTANGIPLSMVWELLDNDVATALDCARQFPWFETLDDVRQRVIVEMIFNMGMAGLKTFTNMLAYVSSGRYTDAALHMMTSQWATQVGKRAVGLAEMMRTGTDPVEVQ